VRAIVAVALALAARAEPAQSPEWVDHGTIRGRVLDVRAQPVAGAKVLFADSARATIFYTSPEQVFVVTPAELPSKSEARGLLSGETCTDEQGRFELANLRAGQFNLLAVHGERGIGWRLEVVPAREASSGVVLALRLLAEVEVSVQGLHFDPTRHVLELKPVSAPGNLTINPRAQVLSPGRYRFGPLPALPQWRFSCTESVMDRAYRATIFDLPVQLGPGARAQARVDLSQGVELAGELRGPDGAPLSSVSVVARSSGEPVEERGGVTNADGRFAIRGLPPGDFTLSARRWTMRPTPGCGYGAKDVSETTAIRVPPASAEPFVWRLPKLRDLIAVGSQAPDFEVATLDGSQVALRQLAGKVVLLDFWATWCGMCRADLPDLMAFAAKHADRADFAIVGVSLDDDPERVRRFVGSMSMPWIHTSLGAADQNPLANLYNVSSTPTSFLIGRDGRIVARDLVGPPLREAIERLLSEAPAK
jgi:peroxiredoxin